jgi:hypothetical protein
VEHSEPELARYRLQHCLAISPVYPQRDVDPLGLIGIISHYRGNVSAYLRDAAGQFSQLAGDIGHLDRQPERAGSTAQHGCELLENVGLGDNAYNSPILYHWQAADLVFYHQAGCLFQWTIRGHGYHLLAHHLIYSMLAFDDARRPGPGQEHFQIIMGYDPDQLTLGIHDRQTPKGATLEYRHRCQRIALGPNSDRIARHTVSHKHSLIASDTRHYTMLSIILRTETGQAAVVRVIAFSYTTIPILALTTPSSF